METKKASRNFMFLWLTINTAGLGQWCLNAIIHDSLHKTDIDINAGNKTTRTFPTPIMIPFEIDTWKKYLVIFSLQSAGLAGSSIGFAVYDYLSITILMFISTHLSYLNSSLISEDDIELITR